MFTTLLGEPRESPVTPYNILLIVSLVFRGCIYLFITRPFMTVGVSKGAGVKGNCEGRTIFFKRRLIPEALLGGVR